MRNGGVLDGYILLTNRREAVLAHPDSHVYEIARTRLGCKVKGKYLFLIAIQVSHV